MNKPTKSNKKIVSTASKREKNIKDVKSNRKRIDRDTQLKSAIKCIVDDEQGLRKINMNRDVVSDGLVAEAKTVLLSVWLPEDTYSVMDILYPRGEDSSYGFLDALETIVKRDSFGVYRVSPRNRKRDIPKNWYPAIETNFLAPISSGGIIPHDHHVEGKGMVYKLADLATKSFIFNLEEVEIISPLENARMLGLQSTESYPDHYEQIEISRKGALDYEAIIKEGENQECEFEVDGFVKTISPSFLDALPREGVVAGGVTEGARRATGVSPPRA